MADLVERLDCLHVWPQSVADHYADTLTPRQIKELYAVGDVATAAKDRIEQLKAEIARKDEALRECRRAVSGGREEPRRRVRDIVDLTLRKPTALEPTNEPA